MKLYFYTTLLLLASTSLYAMEENNNNQVKPFNFKENAADRSAMTAVFDSQTATALHDLFRPFECERNYKHTSKGSTSLSSIAYRMQIVPLTREAINLQMSRVKLSDRNTEEKALYLLKYCAPSVEKAKKDAHDNRLLLEKEAQDNKGAWEKDSKYSGFKWLGTSVLSAIAAGTALFLAQKYRESNFLTLGGTIASLISFSVAKEKLDYSREHQNRLNKQAELGKIQDENTDLLMKTFHTKGALHDLEIYKALEQCFVPDEFLFRDQKNK